MSPRGPNDVGTVGVLGGGRWGVALSTAARRAGHPVLLCTRRDDERPGDGIAVTADVRALARQCTLIVLAVPSDVVRSVARQLGDVVDGSHFVVHGVRGLSGEGLTTVSEVLRQETPARRVGALGGPVLADDLLDGRAALLAVAARFPEVTSAVRAGFGSEALRVYTTEDLTGLEWASALNGCLCVALGYARAVGVGPALVAGLLTRGLHESARIGAAVGAEERTFFGLAGCGDLMAAMGQDDRPEVRLGAALGNGETLTAAREAAGLRVEAPALIPRVVAFARDRRIAAPIFNALEAVLAGRMDKADVLHALMTAPPDGRE